MDHVGTNSTSPKDSIWNGADDDASGTAGVLALAEAFSQAPTRRSIIFLTVSGEEHGLWGSSWFTSHPPVPIRKIVANFNLDMIGRNWKDSIVVVGMEHSDLGQTLKKVSAMHPELGITPMHDPWPQENFFGRSDHYNFARRGVPALFFFNGVHEDYHRPSDSPDKIDAEKESRVVRLIFHVLTAVANATPRPEWNPESYKKIVR
jgi:Zn-dependent M28 family amino/carboxypeptidase